MSEKLTSIQLDKNLSIKKLDPENEKDIWLAKELDRDKLIYGENGYLWSIQRLLNDSRYLFRLSLISSFTSSQNSSRICKSLQISSISISNGPPIGDPLNPDFSNKLTELFLHRAKRSLNNV